MVYTYIVPYSPPPPRAGGGEVYQVCRGRMSTREEGEGRIPSGGRVRKFWEENQDFRKMVVVRVSIHREFYTSLVLHLYFYMLKKC